METEEVTDPPVNVEDGSGSDDVVDAQVFSTDALKNDIISGIMPEITNLITVSIASAVSEIKSQLFDAVISSDNESTSEVVIDDTSSDSDVSISDFFKE